VASRFATGQAIAMRHVWRERIFLAAAHIVVADEPDLLVTWIAPGAEYKRPTVRDELPYEQALVDRAWQPPGIAVLTRPGDAHSVSFFPDRGWYVNLQEPLRRTYVGFDTADHLLDLWRLPTGEWRWKDEHELDAAVARGYLTTAEAAAIRAEGERVIADDKFPTGWEGFEPDADWRAPRLPDGWDELP
jgi:hypothetical protein